MEKGKLEDSQMPVTFRIDVYTDKTIINMKSDYLPLTKVKRIENALVFQLGASSVNAIRKEIRREATYHDIPDYYLLWQATWIHGEDEVSPPTVISPVENSQRRN